MPDTRGRPLPSEILAALKDPSIGNWLTSFILAKTSSESIGRYPGNGSAQNDIYVYPDAADATFPYNFDYLIASNFQRLISAKLSFKVRPYRTYNTITGTNTGVSSNNHTHGVGGESGHSHNHSHSIPISLYAAGVSGALTADFLGPIGGANSSGTIPSTGMNTSAAGSSGHNHGNTGGQSADHTHALNLTQTLGITEAAAPVNPGITVAADGVDITSSIGGPFNADQVELDITSKLPTATKLWHTLTLQPNQKVRLTGILRISYYVDNRLAI